MMSLRSKLLIGVAAIVIFTAASIGYTSIAFVERLVFDHTLSSLNQAAQRATVAIEKWFEVRQMLLKMMVTGLETDDYSSDDPRLSYTFQTIGDRFCDYFDYIYIGFSDKTLVTTRKTPVLPDFDPTTRPWFKAAVQKNGLVITDPYPDRLTGELVSSVSLPFVGSRSGVTGVLGTDIDIADLALLCKTAVFRPEAEAVLISHNNIVLYSTNEIIAQAGQLWQSADYSPLNPYVVSSRNDLVYVPQLERNGEKYALFLSVIQPSYWKVAIAIPVDSLYVEQKRLLRQILAVSLLVLAIGLGLTFWVIAKFTQPLSALAATAQQLESGDLHVQFQASESAEVKHLAACLEKMKSSLLGALAEKDALLQEAQAKHQEKLSLLQRTEKLNQDLANAYHETQVLYLQTIQALSDSIEAKDPYTHGHSSRVLLYSERIGAALAWDEKAMKDLRYAAILHDIGKIGIPETILNKPGSLTDDEFAVVKLHPVLGAKILQNIPHLQAASQAVLQHHEHFDGNGYPHGAAGKAISPLARVLAVSDAFDAMTSERPYRFAATPQAAFAELRRCAGQQFDPQIVDTFCQAMFDAEEST